PGAPREAHDAPVYVHWWAMTRHNTIPHACLWFWKRSVMTYRLPGFPLPILLAAALTLVAGCTSSGAQVYAPVEKPDITVAVVPTTDSTGFYIALHEGLFAAQGLHVTYVPAISAEDVINQQALGQIDVVGGNY